MTHLLDTNICSAHMRRPAGLAHRFFQHAGQIAVSTVAFAELYAGAYKHPNPAKLFPWLPICSKRFRFWTLIWRVLSNSEKLKATC